MNIKLSGSILIVSLTILLLLFFGRNNEEQALKVNAGVPPRERSILFKNDKGEIKTAIDNVKVVAKTSKDPENIVSAFYNKIFSKSAAQTDEKYVMPASEAYNSIYSTFGLENGVFNEVEARAGEAIDVNSFFENAPLSQFIPLYSHNKVVAISIFREYDKKGEKELASVSEMKEGWDSYPPITPYEAETQLVRSYPNLPYTTIPGYYYIEDRDTPYFLYEVKKDDATQYYLVSAYHKQIIVKDNKNPPKKAEGPPPPAKLNKEGFMEVDESIATHFSKEERVQLQLDIELTNKYIKAGILKLDENLNVIYDKRTDDDKRNGEKTAREMYDSDKRNQDSNNHNTSDDRKIDIPSEPAHAVQ